MKDITCLNDVEVGMILQDKRKQRRFVVIDLNLNQTSQISFDLRYRKSKGSHRRNMAALLRKNQIRPPAETQRQIR